MSFSAKATPRFQLAPLMLALATLTGCMGDSGTKSSPASASADQAAAITLNGTPPTEVTVGNSYYFEPQIAPGSVEGQVTYSISGKPGWAIFDAGTGSLSGTPDSSAVGETADITILAASGRRQGSVGPFRIRVIGPHPPPPPPGDPPGDNTAPTISGKPPTSATAGTSYDFKPAAQDADGDTLRFAITNRPMWAAFNTVTGELKGTPDSNEVGRYPNIAINVSDGTATVPLRVFTIRVQATNRTPTIGGAPASTATAGQWYAFTPSATDADGDVLTFSIYNQPAWATFNKNTGRLSGTPSADDIGTYANVSISVSDGSSTADLAAFTITVSASPPSNAPPTITGTPGTTVNTGQAYSFTPTANDADGDTLTFSVQNKPDWATFNKQTGKLAGTPDGTDVGTYNDIVIAVSDGTDNAALPAFSLQVAGTNRAPTISGAPRTTATTGRSYGFTPAAADADGDTLTFSISNKPSWAAFDTSTGRLSGTPAATDAGLYEDVVISVSDGTLSDSLPAFSIQVSAPVVSDTPPTISGSPTATIAAGSAYSFMPTAADADGDALTFSIQNKPSWATFSTATGRLSGTPSAANAGVYTNIIISVSDGTMSTALAAFSITVTVTQPATGSATLSWNIPTQNTDGSALKNLDGYRIYYGTNKASLTQVIDIPNDGTTSYQITNLGSGTWYFGIKAYNSAGVESDLSNVGSKTI